MFFSENMRSLRRGRRRSVRSDTLRPCIVWLKDAPDVRIEGVVLDISPYGMLVRMMEPIPPGTEIVLQLMRDDQFREPLTAAREAVVVRNIIGEAGFTDHGLALKQSPLSRAEQRPFVPPSRKPAPSSEPNKQSRMQTFDIFRDERRRGER